MVADINVSFATPETAGSLVVEVLGGMYSVFIEYTPPNTTSGGGSHAVRVGAEPGRHVPVPTPTPTPGHNATANVSRMMPNVDLGGGDYSITHHPADFAAIVLPSAARSHSGLSMLSKGCSTGDQPRHVG